MGCPFKSNILIENVMSVKNKKQFGVWLDSNHATIVGRELAEEDGDFVILAEAKNSGQAGWG